MIGNGVVNNAARGCPLVLTINAVAAVIGNSVGTNGTGEGVSRDAAPVVIADDISADSSGTGRKENSITSVVGDRIANDNGTGRRKVDAVSGVFGNDAVSDLSRGVVITLDPVNTIFHPAVLQVYAARLHGKHHIVFNPDAIPVPGFRILLARGEHNRIV